MLLIFVIAVILAAVVSLTFFAALRHNPVCPRCGCRDVDFDTATLAERCLSCGNTWPTNGINYPPF